MAYRPIGRSYGSSTAAPLIGCEGRWLSYVNIAYQKVGLIGQIVIVVTATELM